MSGRAETMRLVRRLRKMGFEVERTGSGHWRVAGGHLERPLILPFSPRNASLHATKGMLKKNNIQL